MKRRMHVRLSLDPLVKERAHKIARQEGLTLGRWLTSVVSRAVADAVQPFLFPDEPKQEK
jgi:antitoxin component of RelBE/YafQ-DinJ toxin-antitoxin module